MAPRIEDEFGESDGIDDEDLLLAESQFDAASRPTKRRRLDEVAGGRSRPTSVRPNASTNSIDDDDDVDDDEFDPPPHPIRKAGVVGRCPPPPKHSVHTPLQTNVPRRARVNDPSESPSDEDAFDPPAHPRRTDQTRGSASGPQTVDLSHNAAANAGQGHNGPPPDFADLPEGAFDSSPPAGEASQRRQRLVAPLSGLRQTTLFGAAAQTEAPASQANKRHSFPVPPREEPPTHHKLEHAALRTWVYPINLGSIRDYQYNIVQRGLFANTLVALPTGLGKTFIAASVMLNWFRWTKDAQIVFVAPTKPLVAQQIDACFNIVGIPRSETTMLTGGIPPGLRAEEWAKKRVFFMTPQTMINDLKTGICDPKRIVCLVVDEAHRATGGYAYVEVVKFIRRFNSSFRVLALTATPGASVEAVQEVIDGLDISRVEIRTEESLDIRQYVHSRKVETIAFDPSDDILLMQELLSKALQPVLDKLNQNNAYWVKNPMSLTAYGLTQARVQWMASAAGRNASMGFKGMMNSIFAVLASVAHSITLLNYHGIGPFYHNILAFRTDVESSNKGSKYRKQINESAHFQRLMTQAHRWINEPDFIGHPKLEYLRRVALNHFMDAGEGRGVADDAPPSATRVMIFVQYRDSAEEVVRVLKRNEPMVRPHAFVGQAGAKGSEGMSQKTQLEVVQKFQKGVYNTLVATCVGEEGLDIGEVDLIICYDSSASPIRMLQRMGRTGRKRAGNIVLLLMRGKEEDSFAKAKDGYEKMQQMIAAGTRFTFHEELSPRILPRDVQPAVDKRVIDIPVENTQAELPEPNRRRKVPKRPPKKFHMPDGVQTGFVRASRLQSDSGETMTGDEAGMGSSPAPEEVPEDIPDLETVLLTATEEKELERRYQNVYGDDGVATVSMPRLDAHPSRQRSLGRTEYVRHGRASTRMASMLRAMLQADAETLDRFEKNLHADDRQLVLSKPGSDRLDTSAAAAASLNPIRIDSSHTHPDSVVDGSLPDRKEDDDDDDDDDDDLSGFIVDEEAEEEPMTSLTSSAPSSSAPETPFYTSPQKRPWRDPESDDDLPDCNALFDGRSSTAQGVLDDSLDEVVPLNGVQRRSRRAVLEDSEDEE